jgi:glycosyltransferase involved in cell wall biosynthesis
MKKLAVVVSHPIQYYVPVFQQLAQSVALCVFYTLGKPTNYDHGFQHEVAWDLPLLEHYEFVFLKNTARKASSSKFLGIINPKAIPTITAYQPDCLLIYGWAHYSHFQLLRHFKDRIPILFRGDSVCLNPSSYLKTVIKKNFLRWIYHHIDIALFVGSNNKDYFQRAGLKEEQLVFAPHAVDNCRFSERSSRLHLRSKLQIKTQDLLVLYAGKITVKKGVQLLIEAFIAAGLPGVQLLICGAGKLKAKLIKRYGNQKNLHFLPFQNQQQMPELYHSCDLFCLPSDSESWGLSINEAMAAGKPILCSDRTGAAADLVSPINGAIFKSGNLKDLQRKLTQLCSQVDRLRAMGKISKDLIQYWCFDQQVKQIHEAIKSVTHV